MRSEKHARQQRDAYLASAWFHMLGRFLRSSAPHAWRIPAATSTSCWSAWRAITTGSHLRFAYDYFYEQEPDPSPSKDNPVLSALEQGTPSQLIEFQISVDEAVKRFNTHQAKSCSGMHSHELISSKPPTTVKTAYLPSWCFSCTYTAEFKGQLGFKAEGSNEMVWKDMEDWSTLDHKTQLSYKDARYLQVYASYNFERGLGEGAMLPSAACLSASRPITTQEAAHLSAPAAAAAAPSAHLRPEQRGPATRQEPQSPVSSHGVSALSPTASANNWQRPANTAAKGPGHPLGLEKAVVHPPDMTRGIAWQLAYRGLVRDLTDRASAMAKQQSGAMDTRDMHLAIEIHNLDACLLYLPVYIAHYQHGKRYKQDSSIVTAHMFYAAISGLETGGLCASSHVSSPKAQTATGTLVGGLGYAAGAGPTWLGLEPFVSIGIVESMTLAVIGAALAGMWAQGLTQAAKNDITARQVKAEREFYRQYDQRETKTAAAIALAMQAAEAAGRPAPAMEAGEQQDEYMQWLWMDHDWRRWEMDEPWNWDADKRRQAAEQIAARTVGRRKQRQQYLEKLLEDRRKREYEEEQEMYRAQRGGRAPGSRRAFAGPSADGVSFGSELMRRRRDFLGYYKLLGLAEEEDVTAESIKAAFKVQAMQLHPDRVVAIALSGENGGGSGSGNSTQMHRQQQQEEAHVRFQRLQIAYDVLRDPEKRRAYDRGQLVQ